MKLRIKELAESQGFNKTSFARRCDMTLDTIDKVWKDSKEEAADIKNSTLEKIAAALGVTAKELIA
jgi:transcriptional regulator with XRE-family HTH domain